jgi:hypothetical protein
LANSRVLKEDQEPETTKKIVDLVQSKDHSPKIISPSSISSEDDASRYNILMRKRSTLPRNKFRLKSKAMYNPTIKDKVIIIDEEFANPKENPSTTKKKPTTKLERNKYKNGGLTANTKTLIGKNEILQEKGGKRIREAQTL